MSATQNQPALSPEDEKKQKRREAEQAKKAAAEVEEAISDAQTTAGLAKLDGELLAVETAGYRLVDDWRNEANISPELLKAKIDQEAAKERSAYVERFTIDGRGKAAWAARKIAEARTALEEAKEIMKAEVKRAEREYEGRVEFFEPKLLAWAELEPKDRGTKGSVRLPAAGVRLEVREGEFGGTRILDERLLCDELIEQIGIAEASDLGLVELKPQIVVSAVKDFIEAHPGLKLKHAVVEPRGEMKKLVIVRLAK
jgi:hypothetical protein